MNTAKERWEVKFDMHFHSIRSDWNNSPNEILDVAQEKWLELITLLDHDIISPQDFINWARERWIYSLHSGELSIRKANKKGSMHFWYYSSQVSADVESILEKTREWSVLMLEAQIEKLQNMWFDIMAEDFYKFLARLRRDKSWGNKYTLAEFLFLKDSNKNLARKILQREPRVKDFYLSCLKWKWEKKDDISVSVPEYEPSLEVLSQISKHKNTLISIAHPNFTFHWGIKDFEKKAPWFIELWVGAIEINTKATPEWIDAINKICYKYGLLRTMGSDNHKNGYSDDKHGDFWDLNHHISDDEKRVILKDFKNYFLLSK